MLCMPLCQIISLKTAQCKKVECANCAITIVSSQKLRWLELYIRCSFPKVNGLTSNCAFKYITEVDVYHQ
jgi:hypothetical protein